MEAGARLSHSTSKPLFHIGDASRKGGNMKVSSGWDTKHRVWATRKQKVRSEIPCLENPLGAKRMTSMEDRVTDCIAKKRPGNLLSGETTIRFASLDLKNQKSFFLEVGHILPLFGIATNEQNGTCVYK